MTWPQATSSAPPATCACRTPTELMRLVVSGLYELSSALLLGDPASLTPRFIVADDST